MIFKKLLESNITAIIIAISIPFASIFSSKLHNVIVVIYVVTVFSYFCLLLSNFLIRRKKIMSTKNLLIYKKLEFDFSINETGDFYCRNIYHLKNISKSPISIAPLDNGIWYSKLKKMDLKISIVSKEKGYKILSYRTHIYETFLKIIPNRKSIYICWAHEISPPLKPNDTIIFQVEIDTPGTELDAFTNEGTLAGIPTMISTEKGTMIFSAPKGYLFNLITPKIVYDNFGNINDNETKRINKPELNTNKTILNWDIDNCLAQHRYSFKYRFVKND